MKNNARICPKCRKTVDVKGARFCCFCGTDIRNNKEICAERLENLLKIVMLIPESKRDEFTQAIIMSIKELKGEK